MEEAHQPAQRRVYSLRLEPLAEVDEWLGRYRAPWEQRLDALHTEVAPGQTRTKEHQMTDHARPGTRILGSPAAQPGSPSALGAIQPFGAGATAQRRMICVQPCACER